MYIHCKEAVLLLVETLLGLRSHLTSITCASAEGEGAELRLRTQLTSM